MNQQTKTTTMSDKYSENIQQIAKEMAEAYGNHIVPSGLITAACVAIRWAMPAAKAAYMRGASDKAKGLHCDSVDCDLYMRSIGLIPENTGTEARESVNGNYDQRVRSLATEMAKLACGKLGSWEDQAIRNDIIGSYLPFARIAVAYMAEAIILYAYDGDMKAYKRNEHNGGYVTNYLKDQGLIPDSAQEGGKDEAD